MVSQRQSVPQWLICRKAMVRSKLSTIGEALARELLFFRKKRTRHNGQSFGRYGGPRPTEVSGRVLNHRFPRVQKKKVVRSLQCTQNFLVV